jgi:hypothetical protein
MKPVFEKIFEDFVLRSFCLSDYVTVIVIENVDLQLRIPVGVNQRDKPVSARLAHHVNKIWPFKFRVAFGLLRMTFGDHAAHERIGRLVLAKKCNGWMAAECEFGADNETKVRIR